MEKERNAHAAEVLRRLDQLGAIKLDVLVAKAAEIQGVAGVANDDDDHGICYPFYIRIGPPRDIDLVAVASQVKQLGFELTRVSQAATGKA
ncbi:MAG TPA: hypothetical protein VFA04_19310 [Bryobacteraceae bacterium]|nr:hypothetical protein [Bryobacteraceae bacterium]